LVFATIFQLSFNSRSDGFRAFVIVFQRLYIPLIDLLIVSTLLYFFYHQGMVLQRMKKGIKPPPKEAPDIYDEASLDSDEVGTVEVKNLLLNASDERRMDIPLGSKAQNVATERSYQSHVEP
jgi:hypothetical protein